jgi:hypothetical protein
MIVFRIYLNIETRFIICAGFLVCKNHSPPKVMWKSNNFMQQSSFWGPRVGKNSHFYDGTGR